MKLIVMMMVVFLMQVSAASRAQQLTINEDRISLQEVFAQIRKQTGFTVLVQYDLIRTADPLRVHLDKVPLEAALKQILKGSDLDYAIKNKAIVIVKKDSPSFLEKVVDALTPPVDVRGLVVDDKGPLSGVTVRVKGTKKATGTDAEGRFYLPGVDDKAVLEFVMVGFKTLEVAVKDKKRLEHVVMEFLTRDLEEVQVAYGKTTQRANTAALTVIKGEQIVSMPNRSFDKSLQGLVPGLQITGGTGQPGGGLGSMVIRGISTGTFPQNGSTVRNPLFVIDGIQVNQEGYYIDMGVNSTALVNPLAQINPSDIETITVLKDAAAIALYGSKASNGVILVTTKTGKAGKNTFSFRHQTDLAYKPKEKFELLNQKEFLDFQFELYRNTDPTMTDEAILADLKSKFPLKTDGNFYPEVNWKDQIFATHAATISNEISASGGNDKNTYYLNAEYTTQDGIQKKTGYDRASFRINFESKPLKWLTLGTRTLLSYNLQNYGDSYEDGAVAFGLRISPLNPIRKEDGTYFFNYDFPYTLPNPVASNEFNYNRNTAYRAISKFYGEVSFLNHFVFRTDLGADFMLGEMKEKADPRIYDARSYAIGGRISEMNARERNLISTNVLRYNQTFSGNHSISALASYEAQIANRKSLNISVTGNPANPPLPYYDDLNSPGYSMYYYYGFTSRLNSLSFLGQINYAYKDRYFLSGSIRSDGSSRFGDKQRWGTFWSLGAGWLISAEPFMKEIQNSVSYLKLRGSVGAAGSSAAVNAYTRYNTLKPLPWQNMPAVKHETIGNPNIQWEQTFNWDIGLESRFFDDRIALTLDLYRKKTNKVIYQVPIPTLPGFGSVMDNIGDVVNSGAEASLNVELIKNQRFQWSIQGNWSMNRNKLVKASFPLLESSTLLASEEGRNMDSFYLPRWAGVNSNDGKPQWLDANEQPTSDYNAAKKVFVGKQQPDGYGSLTNIFNYRGFTLSAMLLYQYGSKIYNANQLINDGSLPYINQSKGALAHWKEAGDTSPNPRVLLFNGDEGGNESTRFLFDGDYIRLQNVSLGYNLPKVTTAKLGVTALRIFLQGNNLAVWTKFPGQDPDNTGMSGASASSYPNARSFSIGLNLNF